MPPLPPHITLEHATSMAKALLKGDVDRRGIIRQSFLDKVTEVLPGR